MPDFPTAVPSLPQLPYYTQDDILALFDRILPSHYLTPLKEPGPGYEYLQAVALMVSRVSHAISRVGSGSYIGSSTGGSYATVTVELTRPNAFFGACTLLGRESAPQGTLVGTSDEYYYQLLNDVTFGEGDLGPHLVQARAVVRGWLWNRKGPFTTEDGELIEGPINRLVLPVFPTTPSPPNFDPTILVRQVSDAAGGSAPMLDGIGNDRGISRNVSGITTAQLSRTGTNNIAILPNSVFSTADGFHYATTERVAFSTTELGPKSVKVRPLFLNVPANILPLSQVLSVNWEGSETDPSLSVTSPTPQIESDTDYKARMTLLPSTVTPQALTTLLRDILGNALAAAGKTAGYREVWDLRYQTAYDFPKNQTLTTANLNVQVAPFNGNVFVYDHVPTDALSNRYLTGNPSRGVIVIRLPVLTSNERAALYPAVANSLEQTKPAGATVLYVLGDS